MKFNFDGKSPRRSTIAPARKAMNQYNYTPYQFGSLTCVDLSEGFPGLES
jgi:hypothetical protein